MIFKNRSLLAQIYFKYIFPKDLAIQYQNHILLDKFLRSGPNITKISRHTHFANLGK